jgi:hypothetical protein
MQDYRAILAKSRRIALINAISDTPSQGSNCTSAVEVINGRE